jgi:iron(III) transport system permease protein
MTGMAMYFRILGGGRFVSVGGKGARRVRLELGIWKWPATAFVLLFLVLAMVVPLVTLLYLSLIGFWSNHVFTQPLSLDQYRRLIGFPSALRGLLNSAWLAGIGATLALVLGFVISYRRLRDPKPLNRIVALFAALPLGIPSIVLGLAFLYTFTGGPLPLYGTALILILAYAVHVLPVSMRNSDASLLRIAPELEEAGLVCGDTRTGIVWRILLPALRHPLLTVWGLTFIILFRDVSISILLFTSTTIPSSVALLSIFDQGWVPGAAAYSILMTLISAGAVALLMKTSASIEAN